MMLLGNSPWLINWADDLECLQLAKTAYVMTTVPFVQVYCIQIDFLYMFVWIGSRAEFILVSIQK